jgi:hypothetical protein
MTVAGAIVLWACWLVPVLFVALALRVTRQTELHWQWFAAAAIAYGLYMLAGYATLPANVAALPAEARWYSRLAQLATTAAMMALAWNRHPLLTAEGMGLTLRQNRGSLAWSLLGLAALVVVGFVRNGVHAVPLFAMSPAGWLFNLSLRGFEPEMFYRALELSLFAVALGGTRKAMGWAAVMCTIVFSLGHGIVPDRGHIGYSVAMLVYAAAAGAILVAIRLTSGSQLFGVLGHNLIGLTERLA